MRTVKIKDVCDFEGGSQPPKAVFSSEARNGYIRFVQTRDYKSDDFLTYIPIELARRFCDVDDIMIGRYGPPIFQILRGIEGAYNVALMKAIPKSNILNDYLYYVLKQDAVFRYVDRLSARTGGQTGVDLVSLNEYPILLPEISYQEDVLSILKTIDTAIAVNNRINAELEAMAKLLYDYWFVQFDFPDADGKPYKSSGGKMVWNAELKREMPEGWGGGILFDVTSMISRGISPKYLECDGIPVLNQKCVRNKTINYSFVRRHDNNAKSGTTKLIQPLDVLVNSTGVGTLGRVAIVKRLEEPLTTVDSHVAIVRFAPEKGNPLFMAYTLTEKQSEIESLGEGSTGQTELSREGLGNIGMVLPSEALQLKFERFYEPILRKISNNEVENQKLAELRDWLLPMLMNGQVRVGEK